MMQPPRALQSGLDIDWVFSESCIITWEEENSEPKHLGLGTQPVTLWFGTKQADHLWIILLQRTINLKISDRSVPFEFFLFVDPRSVLFEKSLTPLPSDLPSQLLEAHSAKAAQGWLSASVHQDRQPYSGRVLMQTHEPNGKSWEGMPLYRLEEFESLSNIPVFNIFMINKKTVRKFVNRLQHELPKTLAPIYINLRAIYEGRGGAWDAWELYKHKLASLPDPLDGTGVSIALETPPCESPTLDQAAPPIYSKTDPNATCTPQNPSTPPTVKRPHNAQEEGSKRKKIRSDRELQWAWHNAKYPLGSPTEENTPSSTCGRLSQQSTVDDRTTHEIQPRQGYRDHSGQEEEVAQGAQSSINISDPDRATQDHSPLYTGSSTSTGSLNQINIKPTIFTRRTSSTITLTLSELESLVSNTIRAQIPLIAARVQTHNLTSELTAWAQPSISDYIATHMPAIMYEAVAAHVSDVNDEFEHASAALQETKDDAITEIRSAEQSGVQEVHMESQVAIDDLQEQSQRLSEALIDKCTELEDRLDARSAHLVPPEYLRQPPVGVNNTKEAVKVFERFYRDRLTPEEQVRVLLSIAKFGNAEVFMAAGLESRKMLVAHWSGRKN
ncbi:hypothetical protein M436DRAFT_61980 [Aureobasidium namibiae CBS 147.97]|uniref:Uncharacterized protein n=1 Tax=Aureobasidium namibiae CBS 147.97 TaxID=1043004 RepID=A0A074WR13_9PEZI